MNALAGPRAQNVTRKMISVIVFAGLSWVGAIFLQEFTGRDGRFIFGGIYLLCLAQIIAADWRHYSLGQSALVLVAGIAVLLGVLGLMTVKSIHIPMSR